MCRSSTFDADRDSTTRFVCARTTSTASPVQLTSFKTPASDSDRLKHITILQAARATSAASGFFDPVEISLGHYVETYVDGATGANNPVWDMWNLASDALIAEHEQLSDHIDCLVSIGTGVPKIEPFGQSLRTLAKTLVRISTETEETAEEFQKVHRLLDADGRYCRLNVMNGLQDISLEEYEQRDFIMAVTKQYLASAEVMKYMKKRVRRLSEHDGVLQFR